MSIRDDLKAFVDGELEPARMAEVQAALEADPALKQEAEFMRVLGFEIKRLASEPRVVGRAEAIQAVKRAGWPWWHPFGKVGRFAAAGVFAVALAVILFPVFAQSKDSAKSVASRYRWGRMGAESEAPAADLGASPGVSGTVGPASVPQAPARASDEGLAYKSKAPAALSAPSEVAGGKTMRADTTLPKHESNVGRDEAMAEGSTSNLPASNRMVIQNADMARRVDDAEKAKADAETMTKSMGGYVESSSISGIEDQLPVANLTLRIPAPRFDEAMKRLRAMGEKISESVTGQDVTQQFADVEGRIRVLRAEEDSYVTMLRGARRIGEIIEIKDRLSQVRQELASYEQQKLSLKNLSSLSTINVRFEQRVAVGKPEAPQNAFEDAWAKAVNGLSAVGRALGQAAIYVFVLAPIWLPPVLLFWWLGKRAGK
jgi:hypothetical protein